MNHEGTKNTKNQEDRIKWELSIFYNFVLTAHPSIILHFFVSFVPSW